MNVLLLHLLHPISASRVKLNQLKLDGWIISGRDDMDIDIASIALWTDPPLSGLGCECTGEKVRGKVGPDAGGRVCRSEE